MKKFLRPPILAVLAFVLVSAGNAEARGPRVVHGLHRHQHQLNNRPAPARHTPDLRGAARQKSTR